MKETEVVTGTVSLFDYRFLWEKFKAALDERDKAHADYRALEDENRSLRASFDEAHELWVKASEELASIKARVGGIEKKDPDLCNREYANGWNACRLALEASK